MAAIETGIMVAPPQEIQESGGRLTSQAIASIAEQMTLAEELINSLLVYGQDYGTTPGTQSPGLWDAGASKIIRSYKCHAEHIVLFHEETDDLVSWTIETRLISNAGEIVGSGLGNCSTRETKYKYRWCLKNEALREGYTEADLSDLKTKTYDDVIKYRIQNPEAGELSHTLLTMAAKRSECDAAKSLPGVGSALRAKFDAKPQQAGKPTTATPAPNPATAPDDLSLPIFWSIIKGSGLTEKDAHSILKVASMKDWVASGKTLREALTIIFASAVTAAKASKKAPPATAPPAVQKLPKDIVQADVPDADALVRLGKLYWGMDEDALFQAIGYSSRDTFIEAGVQSSYEAWQSLLEQK